MSNLISKAVFLVLVLAIVAIFIFPKTGEQNEQVLVRIEPGMTTRAIADKLYDSDVIDSPVIFRYLAKLRGADDQLKAGSYLLHKHSGVWEVISTLAHGDVIYLTVTIPEGLWAAEIAKLLSEKLSMDANEFLRLTTDKDFIKSLDLDVDKLEGYLFPETYSVAEGITPPDMIRILTGEFRHVYDDSLKARSQEMGYTKHDIVTIASIIEAEATVDEERHIISAVYHNRLRIGRPLEADPTIQYALGHRKKKILYKDLEVESPYNTYKYPGLPPGPICNPGMASIKAALYPAEVNYLYFVAKGDGTHVFSKTMREHVGAKRKIKREMRNRSQ